LNIHKHARTHARTHAQTHTPVDPEIRTKHPWECKGDAREHLRSDMRVKRERERERERGGSGRGAVMEVSVG
jgi:hypothetical protein